MADNASKANFRQQRSHAPKRKRYRNEVFTIFLMEGANSKRLGRKLRKMARLGTLTTTMKHSTSLFTEPSPKKKKK